MLNRIFVQEVQQCGAARPMRHSFCVTLRVLVSAGYVVARWLQRYHYNTIENTTLVRLSDAIALGQGFVGRRG
jgi:hypothetical protein